MAVKGKKEETTAERKETGKITIGQIVGSVKSFNKLLEMKLDFAVRFQIRNIRDLIIPIVKNFNETRVELIKEFGESDGEAYKVKAENFQKYNSELSKIMNQNANIQIEKIPESAFNNLSVLDIESLDWMIQEGV